MGLISREEAAFCCKAPRRASASLVAEDALAEDAVARHAVLWDFQSWRWQFGEQYLTARQAVQTSKVPSFNGVHARRVDSFTLV